MGDTQLVLKVVAEGLTTSFRYPHFMHGIQPTYPMPPLATLYGHIASTLGYWFDPAGVEVGFLFSYHSKFTDMEHVHLVSAAGPRAKMPNSNLPKATEGSINPFNREQLYRPRLVLYLNRPEWEAHFRSPRYPVILGRSQDLFMYTKVELVELNRSPNAYFQDTLAPYDFARRTAVGTVYLMPRFLDYENNRFPTFDRFVAIQRRVHARDLLRNADEEPLEWWVDPSEPQIEGDALGIILHTWHRRENET